MLGMTQLNIFLLYRMSTSMHLNPLWPWTHSHFPLKCFVWPPNFSHNKNCMKGCRSVFTIYPVRTTTLSTHPLLSTCLYLQHPLFMEECTFKIWPYELFWTHIFTQHSLHPWNPRAVSHHISYNLQIQYSERIQKSRFSNRAFYNCDLRMLK